MENGSLLTPGKQIKAILDNKEAKHLVELLYGFTVKSIIELDAYDDRNFRIICEDQVPHDNPHVTSVDKDGYILKIVNSLDSQKTGFVDAQNELLIFLNERKFICPVPVKQKDGSYCSTQMIGRTGEEQRHVIRLLVFRPGELLKNLCTSSSTELLKNVGLLVAKLDKTLEEFFHPAYETQTSIWVLEAVPKIRDFTFALNDKDDIDFIEKIITSFEQNVLSIMSGLDKGIIHGDLNEHNIIVSQDGNSVKAIIDFGDSHKNCFVFDLAVCLCYMIIQTKSVVAAKYVIDGYQTIRQLTLQEKSILKICICARIAQSIVLGSYSFSKEPTNQYLIQEHPTKWSLLRKLWATSDDQVKSIWGIQS